MFFTFILLAQAGANTSASLLMMVAMFAIVYFFMIRPQMNRVKEQQTFVANLQKGDWVVTQGGIHGKIGRINSDTTMMLEVDKTTTLKVERSMVAMEYTKALQERMNSTAVVSTEPQS
jgi:preprotein translocase subunit YajC